MASQHEAFSMAQMLIRKPIAVVFQSMTAPESTTQFWFTKSSGPLRAGTTVLWEWEMYGASAAITVRELADNEKIVFEWNGGRRVSFQFEALAPEQTYVTAHESGYSEMGDALLACIRDSTGGFTAVLDGMKAFLEHGINLQLVRDKFPKRP